MVIAFVLALAAADANASVATPAAEVKVEAKKPDPFPLRGNVSVTNSVGSGTFNTGSTFNPTFMTTVTLAPSARIGDVNLSLRESLNLEWTDSNTTTYARQIELSDLNVAAAYSPLKLEDLGLGFNVGASVDLPLSMFSRHVGRLAGFRTSGSTNWSHSSGFSAGATLGFGYNLLVPALSQRTANNPTRPYEDSTGQPADADHCVLRNGDSLDNYPCAIMPSIASTAATVNAGYSMLESKLSFSAAFTYSAALSAYWAPEDELSADNAVAGPGVRQRLSADLSASYTVTPWFVVSGGVQSAPPLLAAQPTGFRTPFFDLLTAERYNNLSSIYVDTAFSF